MRTIDGEAGGGQMLRTALTLSVATGTPFKMTAIRGERPTPGLQPQHLAAVRVAAELTDATVEGDSTGSESLTFQPGAEWKTSLSVDVRTAGSLTLLFDTVLPLATVIEEPLTLTATGGTDVKWSPTMEYLRQVKLPLLARYGLAAGVTVERTGFYPAGGGVATLTVRPSTLSPLALDSRGSLEHLELYSKASESLEDANVADRQATHAATLLSDAGVAVDEQTVEYVATKSTGSVIVVAGTYEESHLGVDALGKRGVPSETIAAGAVEGFLDVHTSSAVVDREMADQLIIYLALADGSVRIPRVTAHVETNLTVVEAFDRPVALIEGADSYFLRAPSAADN